MRNAPLAGILPEPIRRRVDKKAFALPEAPWAGRELRDEFRQRLVAATADSGGLFTGRLVEDFDLMAGGRAPYHQGFWRAVSFDAWRRVFGMELDYSG